MTIDVAVLVALLCALVVVAVAYVFRPGRKPATILDAITAVGQAAS